jgi:hypothetical protein
LSLWHTAARSDTAANDPDYDYYYYYEGCQRRTEIKSFLSPASYFSSYGGSIFVVELANGLYN